MFGSFVAPLIGGALIGIAASLLLLANGRVAGVSGIVDDVLGASSTRDWQLAFVLGMILIGAVAAVRWPTALGPSPASPPVLIVAGILVGYGTRLSGGCTSGHGVCGLSRLSPRSLAATLTFMATGVLTVAVVRLLRGGS